MDPYSVPVVNIYSTFGFHFLLSVKAAPPWRSAGSNVTNGPSFFSAPAKRCVASRKARLLRTKPRSKKTPSLMSYPLLMLFFIGFRTERHSFSLLMVLAFGWFFPVLSRLRLFFFFSRTELHRQVQMVPLLFTAIGNLFLGSQSISAPGVGKHQSLNTSTT